jgi:hypothetical protein
VSSQPSLLDVVTRDEKPRKNVRRVSRAQYAVLRDTGTLTDRQHAVLTAIAAFYNRTASWPTPAELTRDMFRRRLIPRESSNIVAPRISDLVNGEWVKGPGKTRVQRGGGVCELLRPKRVCAVTGGLAHPIRIRERGSTLDPHGYGGK